MTAATVAAEVARRLALPARWSRWVKPLVLAAAAVLTIVLLAAYVFPTRTWLDQRAALAETEVELAQLDAERDALEARIAELDTDTEIEALARRHYGLVRPGEEAYAVHPAPERPVDLPQVWPFGELVSESTGGAPGGTGPGGRD